MKKIDYNILNNPKYEYTFTIMDSLVLYVIFPS